jgi:hypothetical protein
MVFRRFALNSRPVSNISVLLAVSSPAIVAYSYQLRKSSCDSSNGATRPIKVPVQAPKNSATSSENGNENGSSSSPKTMSLENELKALYEENAAVLFTVDPVVGEGTPEDIAWMKEKMQCGFCRYFLNGPCKQQYKQWAKCIDRTKEEGGDFAVACEKYTMALHDCGSTPAAAAYNDVVKKEQDRRALEDDEEEEEGREGEDAQESEEEEEGKVSEQEKK